MIGPDAGSTFATTILVGIVMLLILWVVVYIVKGIVYSNLTRVMLVKDRVPLQGNSFQVVAENMPAAINGNDYTYGFWIKLASFEISATHKLLWYRADTAASMRGCPVCLLNKSSNKMHFLLATNLTRMDITRNDIMAKDMVDLRSSEKMAIVTLDYMPMSRWTHIAIVVRDRYVTLLVDGEVYSNGTVEGYASPGAVIIPPSGTIYIGGEPKVSGELTKMEFCNYAASIDEVAQMYSMGPDFRLVAVGGIINLPQYGIRSPIYKIGS